MHFRKGGEQMAKFIFKMSNILDLKYKLEEQERVLYGNARLKLTQEEEKLSTLMDRKLGYENKYRDLLLKKLNIHEITHAQTAISTMKELISNQKIAVTQAEKSLEAARIRLNKAMVDRKTYEVLREKAFEQFKRKVDEAEQKEIDELVSYKFNRPTSYEEEQ